MARAAPRLLQLGFVVVLVAGALPAWAASCTLPDAKELGLLTPSPEPSWTLQEKWVWKQTLAGEVANFNQLYCEPLDPRTGDEAWLDPARSGKPRQVSERFLLDVFAKKHFAEAVPPRGLRIVGALFSAPIDLSGVDFEREVRLEGSRFDGPISLLAAKFGNLLSFKNSAFRSDVGLRNTRVGGHLNARSATFAAKLDMNDLEVGHSLLLDDKAAFKGDVDLAGAKVGGQLIAIRATFAAGLRMTGIEVGQSLFLSEGAIFKGDVDLAGAKVGGQLIASGSSFRAGLSMQDLKVGHDLFLRRRAIFKGDVDLAGAKVGGQLNASGSAFAAGLRMAGVEVGQSLFLREESTFKGDVDLAGAKVGSSLDLSGSAFAAGLRMANLEAGQDLFLSEGAIFKGDVDLISAKVGGQLAAIRATFAAGLRMANLEVGQSLFLRERSIFKGDVDLISAKVGSNLDLSGSTFHRSVDATGMVIEGELRLGSARHDQARWEPTARLVLRNTSVGALQDRQDAWPSQNLQLDGFTYQRLGGLGGEEDSEMMDRPVTRYVGWLGRDPSFSPQPYRQLAGVFREAGADGKANEILYALRERERQEAWQDGEYSQWLGLTLLRILVGYGIGARLLLYPLSWIVVFTVAGTFVLRSGSARLREKTALWAGAKRKSVGWCAWASFDEIIPVIELDKEHTEFINEELAGWRRSYFYLHRIMAYVLGSFVVAGLAGLTQGT